MSLGSQIACKDSKKYGIIKIFLPKSYIFFHFYAKWKENRLIISGLCVNRLRSVIVFSHKSIKFCLLLI